MAYMYILECDNGTYYTGSTKRLDLRLEQHFSGNGANYTIKHKPVKLVYFEEYTSITNAFIREKQVQRWSHEKKKALIEGKIEALKQKAKKDFSKWRNKDRRNNIIEKPFAE